MATTTPQKCNIDPITSFCVVHDTEACANRPLPPMPKRRPQLHPCPRPTQLHDLAIFQWAWGEADRTR